MSPEALLNPAVGTPVDGSHPDGVHHRLRTLRARVAKIEPDTGLESLVYSVSEAVERLTAEHAGMAEELLSVYEQLGVIFEVTRRLPGVQGESAVVDLFVDNIGRSFPKRDVFAVHSRSLDHGSSESTHVRHGDWFHKLIRRARDRSRVLVERPPAAEVPSCVAEAMVGPVFAGPSPGGFVGSIVLTRGADVEAFRAVDMLLLESLTTFCGDLIRNHRLVRELREMSISMVRSLVGAVDQKDPYTSGHSLRVGYYATLLGESLGLGSVDLQMLQWSALLHDVGKIGIRDDVLKKEGKLTEAEFDHMKEHPVRSHRVVQDVPQLADALDGVLHHHEHFDGKGYPSGLAGEDIPLQARIIQIADVFDALTSDRSYRSSFDWRKALEILEEEAGKTVDPHLQRVFDRLIRDELEHAPDGWEKMTGAANRVTRLDEEHPRARGPEG